MAGLSQVFFISRVMGAFPHLMDCSRVLEVGSLGNGRSVRPLFGGAGEYVGTDHEPGPGVDRVIAGAQLHHHYPDRHFAVAVSANSLDRCEDWAATVRNMVRLADSAVIITCPTHGGPSRGRRRRTGEVSASAGRPDRTRSISEADFREAFGDELDEWFAEYGFSVDLSARQLHFYGIRRQASPVAPQAVALIVPVLDNFAGFVQLMASVREPVVPFVLDNWEDNRGVARSWNAGIRRARAAGFTRAVVCNDDVVFTRGQPSDLIRSLVGHRAAVMSANPGGMQWQGVRDSGTWEHSPFYCFAADLDVIRDIGWFDEQFHPAYFEDNDMEYRLLRAGHRIMRDTVVVAEHRRGGDPAIRDPQAFVKNRERFLAKYGCGAAELRSRVRPRPGDAATR